MPLESDTVHQTIMSQILSLLLDKHKNLPMKVSTLWDGLGRHVSMLDWGLYDQTDPDMARAQNSLIGKKIEIKSTGSSFEGLDLPLLVERRPLLVKILSGECGGSSEEEAEEGEVSAGEQRNAGKTMRDKASLSERMPRLSLADLRDVTASDVDKSTEPSDMDMMVVDLDSLVGLHQGHSEHDYYMEAGANPGYVYIKERDTGSVYASGKAVQKTSLDVMMGVLIVMLNEVGKDLVEMPPYDGAYRHGPAVTVTAKINYILNPAQQYEKEVDLVYALSCPYWPTVAEQWPLTICTHASGWPDVWLIHDSVHEGVHLVPVCHPSTREEDAEWRISFSRAEAVLSQDLARNPTLIDSYLLVKLACKYAFKGRYALSTYHLKNTLYWLSTDIAPDTWGPHNMYQCLRALATKLLQFIHCKNLPHFFVHERNMINHLTDDQQRETAECLEELLFDPLQPIFQLQEMWIWHDKELRFKTNCAAADFIGYNMNNVACKGIFTEMFAAIHRELQYYPYRASATAATMSSQLLNTVFVHIKAVYSFLLATGTMWECVDALDGCRKLLAGVTNMTCTACDKPQIDFLQMLFAVTSDLLKAEYDFTFSAGFDRAWNMWFMSLHFMKENLTIDQLIECRLLEAAMLFNQVRTHKMALQMLVGRDTGRYGLERYLLVVKRRFAYAYANPVPRNSSNSGNRENARATGAPLTARASHTDLSTGDDSADDEAADHRAADDSAHDTAVDDRTADDREADDRTADDRVAADVVADDRAADDMEADDKAENNRLAGDHAAYQTTVKESRLLRPITVHMDSAWSDGSLPQSEDGVSVSIGQQHNRSYLSYQARIRRLLEDNCALVQSPLEQGVPKQRYDALVADSFISLAVFEFLQGNTLRIPSIIEELAKVESTAADQPAAAAGGFKASSSEKSYTTTIKQLETCYMYCEEPDLSQHAVNMASVNDGRDDALLRTITHRYCDDTILVSSVSGVLGSRMLLELADCKHDRCVAMPRNVLQLFLLIEALKLLMCRDVRSELADSVEEFVEDMREDVEVIAVDSDARELSDGLCSHAFKVLVYLR